MTALRPSLRTDAEAWAIVAENTDLVWWLINRRYGWLPEAHRDDAYGYGIEGLFRAAQLWDPEQGTLSTYATAWMRQRINRGLAHIEGRRPSVTDRQMLVSLDAPARDGQSDLGELVGTVTDPWASADFGLAIAAVRAHCRDRLDHAILDNIANGGARSLTAIVTDSGLSWNAVLQRQKRLRHLMRRQVELDLVA